LFDWNSTVTFTRHSNFVVQDWTSGTPTIVNPSEPAYLNVTASGITPGSITILGTDENSGPLSEIFSFTDDAVIVSENKFKTITSVTPSWSSYNVNITATDIQGSLILSDVQYGPYVCSITQSDSTSTVAGELNVPGQLSGGIWRISILDFEPQDGDSVTTGSGLNGIVNNATPYLFLNFPVGWAFFLVEDPG